MGYNGGGSQLKPGTLRINRQSHSMGEITVVRHSAIGAVDCWGDPPGDCVTFIAPLQIDWYRVNLESPLAEEVVLLPPSSEIAITTHGHDQYIVYVPLRLFKRHPGHDYSNRWSSLDRVRPLKINQYRRQQLINLLTDSSLEGDHVVNPTKLEHQICEVLAAVLHAQQVDCSDTPRGGAKMKAIRRARDFIMAHMDTLIWND